MNGHNVFSAPHGQLRHGDVPRDIGQLAVELGWDVERSPTTGDWSTAEWRASSARENWRIGLTPVHSGVVAAMLWSGDRLVDHTRGTEAAMCAMAHSWISSVTEHGHLASR